MARKKILVIDESELFRDYLKSRISASGADVGGPKNRRAGGGKRRHRPARPGHHRL
jgi:hypothetical protein